MSVSKCRIIRWGSSASTYSLEHISGAKGDGAVLGVITPDTSHAEFIAAKDLELVELHTQLAVKAPIESFAFDVAVAKNLQFSRNYRTRKVWTNLSID